MKRRHWESLTQQACVKWFRVKYPERIGQLLFAVPNGGKRSAVEASIMRGEGVTAGVADLILLVPRGQYSSLCIEMKSEGGKLTERQRQWGRCATIEGNAYIVVRNIDEFIEAIELYMTETPEAHIQLEKHYIKTNGTERTNR